jgi:hypothetical protein
VVIRSDPWSGQEAIELHGSNLGALPVMF